MALHLGLGDTPTATRRPLLLEDRGRRADAADQLRTHGRVSGGKVRSATDLLFRDGSREFGQELGFPEEPRDTLRRLSPDRDPVLDPLRVQSNFLHAVFRRDRVVRPDAFDVAPIALASSVGDDYSVERPMLAAVSGESDADQMPRDDLLGARGHHRRERRSQGGQHRARSR
eukprot:CAMPEP_0197388950 /NCGR_PEP_ID=MMETSP1165-20131217/1344_1 /TAXON_ID=284809 /ORGANISM="Chrysocystis fragilis, Strain CCMP3189" /LENGTH=171 /DNA_ID=CAMNT_0042914305 /DNA_START=48 /DNA_END=560 /DNA_ORIENTATION=-